MFFFFCLKLATSAALDTEREPDVVQTFAGGRHLLLPAFAHAVLKEVIIYFFKTFF